MDERHEPVVPSMMGAILGLIVRLWLATLRLRLVQSSSIEADGPFVLAFWHGQQFALLRWARLVPMVALVSKSRDGELVARALHVLGIEAARGSSSRGGASGLRAIVRRLRAGKNVAFAVDGPKGPARIVRRIGDRSGVALAAELGGRRLVPMAAACSRGFVFERAWDRFELPLPFTRVAVVLGAPLAGDVTPEMLGEATTTRGGPPRGSSKGPGNGATPPWICVAELLSEPDSGAMWFSLEPVAIGFSERTSYKIENVRVIDAPPERVWSILATGEGMTEWFKDFVSVHWFGTPGGLGSEREVALKVLKVKERFIIWDEGKRLTFHAYEMTLPLVTAFMEDFVCEPVGEGKTRFTWRVHYAPRLVTRLLHPVVLRVFGAMFSASADGLARYAKAHPKSA